jgi:hypothetical protein
VEIGESAPSDSFENLLPAADLKSPTDVVGSFEGSAVGVKATSQMISDIVKQRIMYKSVHVTPSMGGLGPYAESTVSLTFLPPILEETKDMLAGQELIGEIYHTRLSILVNETKQQLFLTLLGRVFIPQVVVDPIFIDFGSCCLGDRLDAIVRLSNFTDKLKTPFEFSSVANFIVKPAKGLIESKREVDVQITFKPSKLGIFDNIFIVSFCDGRKNIEIHVTAQTLTRFCLLLLSMFYLCFFKLFQLKV